MEIGAEEGTTRNEGAEFHRNTHIFDMTVTKVLDNPLSATRTAWRNPRPKGRKERDYASGFLFLLATRSFRITSVFPFPFTSSAAGFETPNLP